MEEQKSTKRQTKIEEYHKNITNIFILCEAGLRLKMDYN